jgi:hypothetical protein
MNIVDHYALRDADGRTTVTNESLGQAGLALISTAICHDQAREADASVALDAEIARAESAYRLMLVADELLKSGSDALLLPLGFSEAHVADLRRRAGPAGGYPQYSLQNIQETLLLLREARNGRVEGNKVELWEPPVGQ